MKEINMYLFKWLNKWNYEIISYVSLLFITLVPLFSLVVQIPNQTMLVAVFYAKASLIRMFGVLCLVNALIGLYCKIYVLGLEYAKRYFLKNGWVSIYTIVLLLGFISTVSSSDPYTSFYGDAYRFEGYLGYISYFGIFLSATLINIDKHKNSILYFFLGTSVIVALATIIKETTGTTLIYYNAGLINAYSGTFINSNHYGYYLAVTIAISTGLFMHSTKLYNKILYGFVFTINSIVLILNNSFGSYLAVIIGMVFCLIVLWIRNGFKNTSKIFILFGILLGASLIFNGKNIIYDITNTLKELGIISSAVGSGSADSVDGGSGRWQLWVNTTKIMLAHPFFGIGPDMMQKTPIMYGKITHNEYLALGASIGIPALIGYLAMLTWFFVRNMRVLKKLDDITIVVLVAAFTYAVSAFVGVSLPISACYFFLMLGLLNSWHDKKATEEVLVVK